MAAEKERRRTRINSKIDQLPPEAKAKVDDMVADSSFTYQDIADWLKEQGYEISRGAVGRYAIRINEAAQRMAEQLEQTRLILDRIERNPDVDPAKAAQAVMGQRHHAAGGRRRTVSSWKCRWRKRGGCWRPSAASMSPSGKCSLTCAED